MTTMHDPALREVSILIHAFELVFRKLIRLLIGRISLKRIQQMIQVIFVEEAEAKLQQQSPGQNVALADLAMLADLDTRTIKKTRSYTALSTPLHQDSNFLSELIPETCVLDFWGSNSRYRDPETGKPKVLKILGPDASFESLIKEATSTQGVAVNTFLKHLIESESIEILPGGNEVRFISEQYTSFASTNETASLKVGLAVVSNLLDTITHNIHAPMQGEGPFYQRGCWTTRLSKEDRHQLREMTRRFLSKSDEKARKLIGQYERKLTNHEQVTAGISMFYFEEEKAA
ncbi:MAG: hypothetical protein WBS20_12335 [Lysobacterales bacterium]